MNRYYNDTPNIDTPRIEFLNNNGKRLYQKFHQLYLRNWISQNTLHDSILLYHSIGTGKTCTAIGITEGFKEYIHGLDKKIVIVASSVLQENFKSELLSKCTGTNYITESDRGILDEIIGTFTVADNVRLEERDEIEKRVKSHINKYYSFHTYESISTVKDFTDTVLVIDEAHSISDTQYSNLLAKLEVSFNYRLVLLTGTPVYDNCDQILSLSNLLNANDISRQISRVGFSKISSIGSGDSSIYKELLPGALEKLEIALSNKVSFINEDVNDYPERIDVGESLEQSSDYQGIIVVKCQMSKYQSDIYDTVSSNIDKQTVSNYALSLENQNILDNLSKHSSKIFKMTNILQETNQKSFVYSYYLNTLDLIANVLISKGYSEYTSGTISGVKRRFIMLDGRKSPKKLARLIKQFNDPINKNGDYISIVLGSSVITEGVTFKCVRQVHIVEPHWNVSKINQVIGRAIRSGSHNLLDASDRNTSVYKYISLHHNNEEDGIDTLMYKTARLKSIESSKVLRLLKEISIDCSSNASRYKRYISNKNDNSEECDYTKCELVCKVTPPVNYNRITYNLGIRFFDKFQLEKIKDFIIGLFKMYFVWDISNILKLTASKFGNVSKESVFLILGDIVESSEKLNDMYNRNGIIIQRGPYYIFNADGIDINGSLYSKTKCEIDNKDYMEIDPGTIQVKDTKKKRVIEKAQSGRSIILSSRYIYGIKLKDDQIGLCFKESLERIVDRRKECTGRNIVYNLETLLKMQSLLIQESKDFRYEPVLGVQLKRYLMNNNLIWEKFSDIEPNNINQALIYIQVKVSALAESYGPLDGIPQELLLRISKYLNKQDVNFVKYSNISNSKADIMKSIKDYVTSNKFVSDPNSDTDDDGLFIDDF